MIEEEQENMSVSHRSKIEMGDDSFVQTNAVTRMGQKATRSHQDSIGRRRG